MEQQIKIESKAVSIEGAISLIVAVLSILIPIAFLSNGNYIATYIIRSPHLVKNRIIEMKKYFICAFLFGSFITANKAAAQQGFTFSLKTTPLYSFLRNNTDINNANYRRKTTFNTNFGIGSTYNFTENMGIGSDVLYACQGQRYTINGTWNNYYQKNKFIKVPLYLSYNTDASKRVSFIGKIGPQISFLTQSGLDYDDGSKLFNNTKDEYKTTTFGGMALAGTQYKLSDNLYITSGIRFDYDCSNEEDYHYTAAINDRSKTHNMTTGVEFGFRYVFRK